MDEEDENEEDIESTETPQEPSLLSKVASYLIGADETDDINEESVQASDKNETETESLTANLSENLVQNDTNREPMGKDLPTEFEKPIPEAPVKQESTKEEQNDEKTPEVLDKPVDTTTPLPEFDEIGAPPVQNIIVTTPTPPPKVEDDTQKPVEPLPADNVTNSVTNNTEKDRGAPEFKPIPDSTPQIISNKTEEELAPETPSVNKVHETVPKQEEILTKVPGTANVITTPPPLLGLMKSQILKDAEKKNQKPEVETAPVKPDEPKKIVEEIKTEIDSKLPVNPEEINEILSDEPIETNNSESTDTAPESIEETVEKVSDKEISETEKSELEKVMEKLGAAPEKVPETDDKSEQPELTSEGQKIDEKSEKVEAVPNTQEQVNQEESTEEKETSQQNDEVKVEAPVEPISLGIDTYGNPPPPMKPIDDPSNVATENTIKIDNKLDLHDEETIENPSQVPVLNQPEQAPLAKEAEQKTDDLKPKDQDFHQKREAIKSLLESEAPKHGSEIDSSEVKQPQLPTKVKQGVPSIIEIRHNGKIITPKEIPVDTEQNKQESSK